MFLLMSATRVSSHSHYMFVTERLYQEVDGRRGRDHRQVCASAFVHVNSLDVCWRHFPAVFVETEHDVLVDDEFLHI